MLTWREFIALLVAGIWDFAQITMVGALIAIASRLVSTSILIENMVMVENIVLCSGPTFVSILLAILLKPHWALLPMFILENIPFVNLVPTTTAGTFYVIRQRRKAV